MSTAANLLTIATILVGLSLTRSSWLRLGLAVGRQRARRRAGCTTTASLGSDLRRVTATTSGSASSVADEARWICELRSSGSDLTLLDLPGAAEELPRLARAYDEHARALARRVLLNSSIPAVERAQTLYVETARYLLDLAAAASPGHVVLADAETDAAASDSHLPTEVDTSFALPEGQGAWCPKLYPSRKRHRMAFDLLVAHRPHLTATLESTSPWRDHDVAHGSRWLRLTPEEERRLTKELNDKHLFDGLLPRLRRATLARDRSSGRERLVLSTAACSYSSVMLDHYAGFSETPVDGSRVRLLTLSLVLTTSDSYLAFVPRSLEAGSHRGRIGPTVNGNLELAPRFGIQLDVGQDGIPDPLLALVREAREEIGLQLDPVDVYATGLASFSTSEERGTHVLLATSKVDLTLEELAARTSRADLVEGRWEIGGSMYGLALPDPGSTDFVAQRDACLDWLVGSPDLTPHARSAGMATLASVVSDSDLVGGQDLVGHARLRQRDGLVDPSLATVREVRIR